VKNQNDLIISIVSVVLALIIAGICFGTKRKPVAPAAPEVVVVTKPQLPTSDVKMANGLPGASQNTPGGFGGARGGGAAGPGGGAGGPAPQAAGVQGGPGG